MVHLRLLCVSALIALTINAKAQMRETYGGAVEIMELDDNRVTFSSKGIDTDEGNVLIAAEKNLFQKLLYDGVEGYNDDKPLVERNSSILDAFFHGKYQKELMGIKTGKQNVKSSLAYRAYVISSQLDGKPQKNAEGKYEGTAVITINNAGLMNYLRMNKVILDGDTVVIKEDVRVGRPNFLQRRRNSQ